MTYFGTDGIRGIVDVDLTHSILNKIARAVVSFYNKHKLNKVILVGNDSRISSDYILTVMSSVFLRHGMKVDNLKMCASPTLAFITKKYNYPMSMMISASHNSSEYNGIKFFNSSGEKISHETELEIEHLIDKKHKLSIQYNTLNDVSGKLDDYVQYISRLDHSNFNFILDCANGGACDLSKKIYPQAKKINVYPTGNNINKNSGCTNIESLQIMCRKLNTIGFSLDGDADRLIAVDSDGTIISGDRLLYILSRFYSKSGDYVVGSIYSNTGLELALKKQGITLIRSKVGDKNIYKNMCEFKANIGGEDSGHIIVKDFTNTGDGLLNIALIRNILSTTKSSLKELLAGYTEYYQAHANLKLTDDFIMSTQTQNLISEFEKTGSRIVIRKSGTEPILRLMVENKNKSKAEKQLKEIIESLK